MTYCSRCRGITYGLFTQHRTGTGTGNGTGTNGDNNVQKCSQWSEREKGIRIFLA